MAENNGERILRHWLLIHLENCCDMFAVMLVFVWKTVVVCLHSISFSFFDSSIPSLLLNMMIITIESHIKMPMLHQQSWMKQVLVTGVPRGHSGGPISVFWRRGKLSLKRWSTRWFQQWEERSRGCWRSDLTWVLVMRTMFFLPWHDLLPM